MPGRPFAVLLVLCFAAIVFTTTSARATIARTYVASFGNDADPCTLAAPCRTLNHALTETSSAGEIIILDSGDYDSVSITQSVSILASEGIYAGIRVTSGNGITVNGSGIAVVLRGLTIKSTGTGYAIYFQSGASLHVDHVQIFDNTTYYAIRAAAGGKLFVTDTTVRGSALGAAVESASASATFLRFHSLGNSSGLNIEGGTVELREVVITGPNGGGIFVNTNEGGTANVTMERSTVSGCNGTAIVATGAGTKLVITGSVVTHNVGDAVDSTNGATVVISGSTFTRNTDYGFYLAGGGVIKSTGDNTVEGNALGTILGGSLTTLAKQ